MGFELKQWLPGQQQRVEQLLFARLEALVPQTPPRLAEAMRYSLLGGGKRLRPVLCLTFADTVAGASNGGGSVADDAAWALECIHTYSLIHDDLPAMDDDELRRGRPTSHKVFGEAMAILAGDALLTDAFAQLAAGPEPVRSKLVAALGLAAGGRGMVGGQVLDIATDRLANEGYLLQLHRMKTGALIKAACQLGALAGGGDDRVVATAAHYGDAIGLAFQIADDLLDVTSTPEKLGKPTQADAAAGRHTFPVVIGFDASRRLAAEQVDRALAAVSVLEPGGGPLAAIARWTVERTS